MDPGSAWDRELDFQNIRSSWRGRSGLATVVRAMLAVSPSLACAGGSVIAAFLLPAPAPGPTVVVWWGAVVVAGAIGFVAGRLLVVRFAPLAALLDLALVFPGEAPSRYSVARRARSVDEARRVLENMDEDVSVQAAAEASLALVIALERHDPGTRGHSERVRLFADLVGSEMGVNRDERIRLRWSALLHDLGKLHVHADILNKPGRPDAGEWEALKRHPLDGDRLVRPLRPWLGDWVDSVLEHHERFDGTGYPHGTAGDDLSLGGRIVSVADAYETMTARRAYKRAMTAQDARAELVSCSGSHFDPAIVRAFLAISLPRPTRRAVAVGWVASLPAIGLLGRLPREATATTAVAAVSVVAVVAAGLVPGGNGVASSDVDVAPSVVAAQEEPQPAALEDGPATVDEDVRASRDVAAASPPAADPSSDGGRPDLIPTPIAPAPPSGELADEEPAPQTVDHALGAVLTLQTSRPGEDRAWTARWPLTPTGASSAGPMPNYDRDRDELPGLTLRTADGRPTTRIEGVPAWTTEATTASGPVLFTGDVRAILHVDLPPATNTRRAVLDVDLLDCTSSLTGCGAVAAARVTATIDGGGSWQAIEVPLGPVLHVLRPERALALTITISDSPVDVLLGFGTSEADSRIDGLTVSPLNLLALPRLLRNVRLPEVRPPAAGVRTGRPGWRWPLSP